MAGSKSVRVLLLLLAACAAVNASSDAAPDAPGAVARRQLQQSGQQPGSSASNPRKFILDVTVGTKAPDCVSRKVILINGVFQPALTFVQGEYVEVLVKNNIPLDWPTTVKGLTIHFHGFGMRNAQWYDGTKGGSQCPIAPGTSFTYRFKVEEMPGTYWYHDHATMNRADGLQGALIVEAPKGTPALVPNAGGDVLFLSDWWHFTGNALSMRLNRPFDPAKASAASGSWCWVGLPKSILINGLGNYYDCEDVYTRQVNKTLPTGQVASPADVMAPNACVAGQLGAAAVNNTCNTDPKAGGPDHANCKRRAEVVVVPRETKAVRIINAATLVYMTVCFEKHTVTVVALDAAPVEPKSFYECVDINSGQRVDLLLKADQPIGRYWISVGSQYRKGAPAGYGYLTYREAINMPLPDPKNILQPATLVEKKWNQSQIMSFKPHPILLNPSSDPAKAAPFIAPKAPLPSFVMPTKQPDQRFVIQSTQPIIEANGMLRWAFDQVAHATAPPCKPILDSVYEDPNWAKQFLLSASSTSGLNQSLYWTPIGGGPNTWQGDGKKIEIIDAASPNAATVLKIGKPGAGTHILTLKGGDLIEIVIQNDRAGLYGGEYNSSSPLTSNRNGREQHSFHLHGHHFWVVGMGMGAWTPEKIKTDYVSTPILRDTATVLFNGTTDNEAGWVALRFGAINPGVWPLHCHIAWHEAMGQGLVIVEDAPAITKLKVPADMPKCPDTCLYSFANYNPAAAQQAYGNSGLLAPDNSNLP